jgi:Domain of unknown function (DUF4132)
VLKWIKNVFGGTDIHVPEGVPEEWVNRVQKFFVPLQKVAGARANLPHELLDYVLNDTHPGVLHDVVKLPQVGEALQVLGYHFGGSANSPESVYERFNELPTPVALRWARLVEACAAAKPVSFVLQLPCHWPEVLLLHSGGHSLEGWSSDRARARSLTCKMIETLLRADGHSETALLVASFASSPTANYYGTYRMLLITDLPDYAEALAKHVETIRPHITPPTVPQRLHAIAMLEGAHAATLDALAPELAELGIASSKQVRQAAEGLFRKMGDVVYAPLQRLALESKPDGRANALRLIFTLANAQKNTAMQQFARDTAANDKAASVQALVKEWQTETAVAEAAPVSYRYEMPVIDWSAAHNKVPDELLTAFWGEVRQGIDKSNQNMREHHARMKAQGHNFPLHEEPQFKPAQEKALRAFLGSAGKDTTDFISLDRYGSQHVVNALEKLAANEQITPVALFKLLRAFQQTTRGSTEFDYRAARCFEIMHARSGRPTLLELGAMLEETGSPGSVILRNCCPHWGAPFAGDWPNEHVWPYFAHHVDRIVQLLLQGSNSDYAAPSRDGLFRAIATLPSPPPNAINAMFNLALGAGKTDRALAQAALNLFEGKEARIIDALSDGKSDTRAVAASWLETLKHEPAIPALERALAKEKHDIAKGAMLDALHAMGQPIEKYLDRETLLRDASKAIAKGLPKDLEWIPRSALPTVRWADNGQAVPLDVLQWLFLQAVKQKQAEPNAILRNYCAMFEPRDRDNLGQFVLENWLREDVRPITPEAASERAKQQAQSTHQYMAQYPQVYQQDPNFGKSVDELFAAYLPGFMRQPQGSATSTKGLLAIVAVCGGERVAAPVQRYLKEWYGSRASQGKALIAMLAWIDHPSATQLMLAIGNRFRTKSFQEEATRQAEALAERKGWTLYELADRTIPTAGFDETGTMELSYGMRAFQAKLLPDFRVELYNPDGKTISALPEPRQDDDQELAKESKKAFSSAKKELKAIIDLQTDRLYEALCTERDWPRADWQAYLFEHPVLRHLVQRLVWVVDEAGQATQMFRPLDDGTLSDAHDDNVTLTEHARIRLAHDSRLSEAEVQAWQQHLIDYDIMPLFQQLGKGSYALPADKAKATVIEDFKGHLIEAYALRGRALKLGYTRGAAEDGGWFMTYVKRFPTLGLVATIEFTGNPLPEENRTVALVSLAFSNTGDGSSVWQRPNLPLAKVPKVLLSECYNDLRLIAAESSGFDPEWEKKSEY